MTVVSCDDQNIYLLKDNKVFSSDVGIPILGTVPFAIKQFQKLEGQYYFLDYDGKVWCNSQVVATGVKEFNEKFILYTSGMAIERLTCRPVRLGAKVSKLAHDLLLDEAGLLYDSCGQHLLTNVVDAHTDGNEIIAIKKNGGVEYIGDNDDTSHCLNLILSVKGVKKAVVSDKTILLLSYEGELIASGENNNYECGIDMVGEVDWICYLQFPSKVVDFDFQGGVGWALLVNGEVWVWGRNPTNKLKFLQWEYEEFIAPRKLVM